MLHCIYKKPNTFQNTFVRILNLKTKSWKEEPEMEEVGTEQAQMDVVLPHYELAAELLGHEADVSMPPAPPPPQARGTQIN